MGIQILQYFPGNLYEALHSSQYVILSRIRIPLEKIRTHPRLEKNEYSGTSFEYSRGHSGIIFAKEE